MSSSSSVLRASSSETSTSCSFSPGRMPMDSTSHPGAMRLRHIGQPHAGNLGDENFAAVHLLDAAHDKRTPCSSVSQKRVMRGSVMVILPRLRCSMNTGITLPRLPTTLP